MRLLHLIALHFDRFLALVLGLVQRLVQLLVQLLVLSLIQLRRVFPVSRYLHLDLLVLVLIVTPLLLL
jgi:hypothetical protein